jgi:hypothetical protein
MILISHRGNILGQNPSKENMPSYIQNCIDIGFDCEIDLFFIDSCFFLGHDSAEYKIELDWLKDRKSKLWVHCKNLDGFSLFNIAKSFDFNYFWHETDKATLTSKGFIWSYPGTQPIKNSIAVMPENHNEKINFCIGVCSDYIQNYKE